jgi:uncharacterized membrane protein
MNQYQKTAVKVIAKNMLALVAIVVGLRVFIELFGVQVFGITMVSLILVFLIKAMYEIEVDKAERLDRLNSRNNGS